jgi:soluble lytic murein transglycosylase-like protein
MAVSPKGALGSTQMLPGTAREMSQKLGLPFRPDLLRSNTPEALSYQRRLGEAYFQQGLHETGNLRDALRYYHGGPDRSLWGPKTNAYADSVLRRMGAY